MNFTTMRNALLLCITLGLLAACGIKGGLYLPSPADHNKAAPPAPTQPAAESAPKASQ